MRLNLLLLAALMSYPVSSAGREIKHSIVLKQGQTKIAVHGRIPTPRDSVVYEFAAQTGQQVSIHLEPKAALVAQAVLISPSGKQEGPGVDLKRILMESGNYLIRITPREQTSGAFLLQFVCLSSGGWLPIAPGRVRKHL